MKTRRLAAFSPLGLCAVLAAALPFSSHAALAVGAPAPSFNIEATLGGKVFDFSLDDALKKGTVVLYFYHAAFTKGCTIEAHDFAEATDEYTKYGATVLDVSADKLDKLKKFSVSDCQIGRAHV